MYIAIDDEGKLIDIENAILKPDKRYYCPLCKTELRIKNGNINTSHFAHISVGECDTFTYDMSEWHREWQKEFEIENREVVIEKDGIKHRADVCINDYVVEFQHSRISQKEFDARNDFYTSAGYKVIWIFDFIDEYGIHKMDCYGEWDSKYGNGGKYSWKNPCRFMENWNPRTEKNVMIFFQLSDMEEVGYFEKVTWVIEQYGYSDFRRFFTSYYPSDIRELKQVLSN